MDNLSAPIYSGRLIKILIILLLLFLAAKRMALAVPQVPLGLYGTVMVNNTHVPDGTLISAWCGGVKYQETTTITYQNQSWYGTNFDIPGDDPETTNQKEGCTPGETVVLKINTDPADQTINWISGSFRLDLTRSSTPSCSLAKQGDINCDKKIDILDLVSILSNFGRTGGGISGDVNGDNKVDILDLVTLLSNFGRTS